MNSQAIVRAAEKTGIHRTETAQTETEALTGVSVISSILKTPRPLTGRAIPKNDSCQASLSINANRKHAEHLSPSLPRKSTAKYSLPANDIIIYGSCRRGVLFRRQLFFAIFISFRPRSISRRCSPGRRHRRRGTPQSRCRRRADTRSRGRIRCKSPCTVSGTLPASCRHI